MKVFVGRSPTQRDNAAGRLFLAVVPCLYKGDNSAFPPHEEFAEDKSIKDCEVLKMLY